MTLFNCVLQCFDTVGWAAGRASGLLKNGGMVEVGTGWSGWSGTQPDGRCLPLLVFHCTIKYRSYLLAPAHPGGPGKGAVKRLWCGHCGGA